MPIVLDIEFYGDIYAEAALYSVNFGFSRLFAKKSVYLRLYIFASNDRGGGKKYRTKLSETRGVQVFTVEEVKLFCKV